MAKEKQIAVRLDEQTKIKLEEAAARDARSVSNMVEKIVKEWLAANAKPVRQIARV